MRSHNLIQQKTFDFAVRIVQVSKILTDKREYILARQLLKSGTSVGANVEESIGAQSKADFISKLSIAIRKQSRRCIG